MATRLLTRSGGRILGPNGQPASTYLYPSPRLNQRAYKPRYWLSANTRDNLTEYDRWEQVNISRQLCSQIGDLGTAVEQKNSWAFLDSWDPQFSGDQTAWGERTEEWLKFIFYPACNIRGPLFHFRQTLFNTGVALDRDGDDVMVFTESESHFPQVAVFPATRIASGAHGKRDSEVKGGPFDGAKVIDGIIVNRDYRAVGVRIVGETGEDYQDISLRNCDLSFEPEWSDQLRGIPRPARCILRWMNLQDIDEFLQAGMKRAATMQITRHTPEGESVQSNEIITGEETVALLDGTTETRSVHMERVGDGSDVIELSSEENEEIKVLEFKNPHPNAEAFVERIKRECLTSVGWFYELLNLASTGRAPTRMVANLANKSIWARQATGERRARRIIGYAIAKAMKHGFLPRNDNGADAYRWEFGMPAEITVDEGNNEQASREAIKMGMSSKKIEAQKKGYQAKVIRKQRLAEIEENCADAQKLASQYGMTFDRAMELIEQRSPNPVLQPQQQKPSVTTTVTK
jgi:hypothetical protein